LDRARYTQGVTGDVENKKPLAARGKQSIMRGYCDSVSTDDNEIGRQKRNELQIYSLMIIQLWMRNREMGMKMGMKWENMRGYGKSRV